MTNRQHLSAKSSVAPAEPSPALPHWDTTTIYSGLEADDYRAAFHRLEAQLAEFEAWCDTYAIRQGEPNSLTTALLTNEALAERLSALIDKLNAAVLLYRTLDSFIYAFLSTNSYDAQAVRETSRLEVLGTRRQLLEVRSRGWIGTFASRIDTLLAADPRLQPYRFFLHEAVRRSRHLMSEPLEALAADLVLDGAAAFEKLQGSITSQLEIAFEQDGSTQLVPIAVVRNHSFNRDRDLRQRAYDAEQAGWHSIRTPVAACLNGVKGTALALAKRRGYQSVLQVALDDNHIDQATLAAMLGAIRDSLPMFHRYLQAKARHLGLPKLAWWDLFAPVGAQTHTLGWDEARQLIVETFARFDADLADFATTAFDQQWIDAPPRAGKRGGAFCMEVMAVEQSRILINFDGSFEQTSTLAHELGHGYHNRCQHGLPAVLRGSPMGLAETASIFCETLLAEGMLSQASPAEQAAILETQICNATQVCVDILSRFEFESAVLDRRAQCELTADEFCDLILAAQRHAYGDAIDPDTYHRYMWLWKPHYYGHQSNFYNFPYAFGLLFSLGLYARFCDEGAAFVSRYQQLLRNTNCELAAPLAARFGIDITQRGFWQAILDVVARQVERFERLAPERPCPRIGMTNE